MITNVGKTHIKKFFVGQAPSVARSMALGIGDVAASADDLRLSCETQRVPIIVRSYDPIGDHLIFKAVIPESYIGKIYEIGLYSSDGNTLNVDPSQVISTFEQFLEGWTGGTWSGTNARVGTDAFRLTATTSGNVTGVRTASLDLSLFSPTDAVNVSYFNAANTSSIDVRFLTDSSNYYTGLISTPATGYNVTAINKSAFTATGSPSWNNITEVNLIVNANSTGPAVVDFDSISFIDQDYTNPEMVLVARKVLDTPVLKVDNSVNEIEFRLNVGIT